MKKILFLIGLLAANISNGQTYTTLTAGTNEFFIDGTSYALGSVGFQFASNNTSRVGLFNIAAARIIVGSKPITQYKRANGYPFADSTAIMVWADSFAYAAESGGVTQQALDDTASALRGIYYKFRITGATGTSATATIPSGMTNCVMSFKNETHPTTPFSVDAIPTDPRWNISGTTLTVYFKSTGGTLNDIYTITGLVW